MIRRIIEEIIVPVTIDYLSLFSYLSMSSDLHFCEGIILIAGHCHWVVTWDIPKIVRSSWYNHGSSNSCFPPLMYCYVSLKLFWITPSLHTCLFMFLPFFDFSPALIPPSIFASDPTLSFLLSSLLLTTTSQLMYSMCFILWVRPSQGLQS